MRSRLLAIKRAPTWVRVGAAVAARPGLWATAIGAGAAMAPERWWRRPPFLPLPDRRWLHFRMVTAYGGDGDGVQSNDVITWLEWKRDFPST